MTIIILGKGDHDRKYQRARFHFFHRLGGKPGSRKGKKSRAKLKKEESFEENPGAPVEDVIDLIRVSS